MVAPSQEPGKPLPPSRVSVFKLWKRRFLNRRQKVPPKTQSGSLTPSMRLLAFLGVDYFSIYRLIQRGKLRACRALRGKLLVPRSELLRLLKS